MDFTGGLTVIKTVFDTINSFISMKREGSEKDLPHGELIKIGENLTLIRQTYQALLDRNRALEKELAELKDWKKEKERYQLRNVGNATDGKVPIRILRQEYAPAGDEVHVVCAHCLETGKKSPLRCQPADEGIYGPGMVSFLCNRCDDITPPCSLRDLGENLRSLLGVN